MTVSKGERTFLCPWGTLGVIWNVPLYCAAWYWCDIFPLRNDCSSLWVELVAETWRRNHGEPVRVDGRRECVCESPFTPPAFLDTLSLGSPPSGGYWATYLSVCGGWLIGRVQRLGGRAEWMDAGEAEGGYGTKMPKTFSCVKHGSSLTPKPSWR